MENLQLTAVFVKAEEGGFVAYLKELRGVITQGETIAEAEENLYDALQLYLEPDDAGSGDEPFSTTTGTKPFISLSRAI